MADIAAQGGGFADGLFGGMQSWEAIHAMQQENEIRQAAIDAGKKYEGARNADGSSSNPTAPDGGAGYTPINQTVGGTPATPGVSGQPAGTAITVPVSGPVADVNKLPPLPSSNVKPKQALPTGDRKDKDDPGLTTPPAVKSTEQQATTVAPPQAPDSISPATPTGAIPQTPMATNFGPGFQPVLPDNQRPLRPQQASAADTSAPAPASAGPPAPPGALDALSARNAAARSALPPVTQAPAGSSGGPPAPDNMPAALDPGQAQLAQLRQMPPQQLQQVVANPAAFGISPQIAQQVSQERQNPMPPGTMGPSLQPAPGDTMPRQNAPLTPSSMTPAAPGALDPNAPQLQQLRNLPAVQLATIAADPAKYGVSATLARQVMQEKAAGPSVPQMGPQGQPDAPSSGGLGSRLLGAVQHLNPIGSAQAAPTAPQGGLPPARMDGVGDHPNSPALPPVGKDGAGVQASPTPPTVAAAKEQNTKAAAAPVAPDQAGPTSVSEPPTSYVRPMYDVRPYAALTQQSPEHKALVDKVASEEHINPARLALTWYTEGGLHASAPDGKAGEHGVTQVMPATAKMVDPEGKLNPAVLEDSLRLGAKVINVLDRTFGQDTPASIVAYQGGPGAGHAFIADPVKAARERPNGAAYLAKAFPGMDLTQANFQPAMHGMDGNKLIQAGVKGGPDGFINYLAQSTPKGVPMSDAWRGAETAMVKAAIMKGDYAGVDHARDFVAQMAQQGSTTSLMNAYKAMSAGDSVGAAQQLARAHAFFPDGSMGKFGVDKAGNVWATRVDEHDPSRQLGAPFQVDVQKIQTMMTVSQNPATFIKMMQEQSKSAADVRLKTAQSGYYEKVLDSREEIARNNQTHKMEMLTLRQDQSNAQLAAKQDAAAGAAAMADERRKNDHTRSDSIAKELLPNASTGETLFGATKDPAMRGAQENAYMDMRHNDGSMSPGGAQDYASGVTEGRYGLAKGKDGNYAIVDPASKQPLAMITAITGARLERLLKPAASAGALPATPARAKPSSSALPPQNVPGALRVQ